MSQPQPPSTRIAVILPCLNEAAAIEPVIESFRSALPAARIFVIDNGSTDDTATLAAAAGATVLAEPTRGKGNAVRRAFAAIDSDIYVLADGDGTYDANAAPGLISALVDEHLDMVIGCRRKLSDQAFRARHEWGNRFFNNLLYRLFGSRFTDVFSGYRVFSRRYVRSFPSSSTGFEIETEMTMHAILLRMPVREIACDYRARPAGSVSKLNTWRDGIRISRIIVKFFRRYRPLVYYGLLAITAMMVGLGLCLPILATYLKTGLVPRFPTLIVAIGLGIVGILLATLGILLQAIKESSIDTRRLLYLNADQSK